MDNKVTDKSTVESTLQNPDTKVVTIFSGDFKAYEWMHAIFLDIFLGSKNVFKKIYLTHRL